MDSRPLNDRQPSDLAPIVLFVYNRPTHTLATLQALANNRFAQQSTLYIFSDGPKRRWDRAAVEAVRKVIRQRQWCGTVHVREKATNYGLANSVIDGISEVIDRHGRAIVVEDDLVTSPEFLPYLNRALNVYQDQPRVMQVSGYMYPIDVPLDLPGVFLPITSSWGWATWKRAWKQFDPTMAGANAVLSDTESRRRFDLDDSHPCSLLVRLQQEQRIDTWDIQWYLSVFRANGLVLYPSRSLVQNIGFDGTGRHCTRMSGYEVRLQEKPIEVFPEALTVDERVYRELVRFHRALRIPKPPMVQRALRRLRHLFLGNAD
jgi:hypothetical protein